MMAKLTEAVDALKASISKSRAQNKAQLAEAVSQLQSYFVFLVRDERRLNLLAG